MTNKYTSYFADFFELIFSTSKMYENKIEYVNLELKKATVVNKNFIRIYITVKLISGEYVIFSTEEKYLSYHIPDYEEYEYKASHPIHNARQDMYNAYHLLKMFNDNLKVNIMESTVKFTVMP